jgi:hypothetical protein
MKGENETHSTKRKPGQCEKQILIGQRASKEKILESGN